MELTDSQIKYIIGIKKEVESLALRQDALYQKTREQLNTKDEDSWLFDFIYNDGKLEDLDKLK